MVRLSNWNSCGNLILPRGCTTSHKHGDNHEALMLIIHFYRKVPIYHANKSCLAKYCRCRFVKLSKCSSVKYLMLAAALFLFDSVGTCDCLEKLRKLWQKKPCCSHVEAYWTSIPDWSYNLKRSIPSVESNPYVVEVYL